MAWVKKVNRHVAVLTTIGGKLRRRPAVITSLALDGNPVVRVRHHGETYGNGTTGVPQRTNPNEAWTVNKYVSY